MSPKLSGLLALALLLVPAAASAAPCPTAPEPGALASAADLKTLNAYVARLGARPTGSPEQAKYIGFLRRRLRKIGGLELSELRYPIDRWSSTSATLRFRAGGRTVRLPGARPRARGRAPPGCRPPPRPPTGGRGGGGGPPRRSGWCRAARRSARRTR